MIVAIMNWISFSCIDGLTLSIKYQIINGTKRFIKFVNTKLINSFNLPFLNESLNIIFLERKYEIITPNIKPKI